MSKTTFFKRIAVSAIAALGLGMLSVAPSQAIAGAPTLTAANGTAVAGTGAADGAKPYGETSTAATVTVEGLLGAAGDSYVVAIYLKTPSATAETALGGSAFNVFLVDTSTYTGTRVDTYAANGTMSRNIALDSSAVRTRSYETSTLNSQGSKYLLSGGAGFVKAKFGIQVDSSTSRADGYGSYVFSVIATPYTGATAGTPVEKEVTLVVARDAAGLALAGGTAIDPSKTKTVLLGGDVASGSFNMSAPDSSLAVVATADGTIRASLKVTTVTEDSDPAPESVTVTITGPGLVRDAAAPSVAGKSLTVIGTGGSTVFDIVSDGTAGTASIVVKTTTVTFPAKTMVFYAEDPSTVVASVNKPVISVGSNDDVVRAVFKDANGNVWAGSAYIYSADEDVAGDADPVACTFSSTYQFHYCPIAGATKGTTTFKVIDADTVGDENVASDAQSVRVSTGVASSVVLSFDKATYKPGEKAQLRVSVLDGEGLAMPGTTITNALAAGGITTASAWGTGSDTTSAVTFDLSGSTSAASNTNAGHKTYMVYMPQNAGVVSVSATGGAGIAASGRVEVTASATVVDTSNDAAIEAASAASDAALEAIDAANAATDAANLAAEAADAATVAAEEARDAADAATAAVEALASEVATLMAALKAQITTLAKTVAKIAKKVKA